MWIPDVEHLKKYMFLEAYQKVAVELFTYLKKLHKHRLGFFAAIEVLTPVSSGLLDFFQKLKLEQIQNFKNIPVK